MTMKTKRPEERVMSRRRSESMASAGSAHLVIDAGEMEVPLACLTETPTLSHKTVRDDERRGRKQR